MLGWKERRRRQARERPFPADWRSVLEDSVPRYRRLPPEDRDELRGHVQVLLAEKHFEGTAGLEVTDRMRLVVAAQAAILLLHRPTDYFPKLVSATLKRDLVGLEVLAGIPGSVGGVVRMNAGGHYGEIGRFVRQVRVLEPERQVVTRAADEIGFAYRHTNLGDCVVLGVTLRLQRGDGEHALSRYHEILAERQRSQPPLAARSAGCIFRNPPQHSAGRLLDEAGLKGVRVGGAEISPRHANFILARDDATADDVLNLIQLAKDRVRKATGIELEPEVDIW